MEKGKGVKAGAEVVSEAKAGDGGKRPPALARGRL